MKNVPLERELRGGGAEYWSHSDDVGKKKGTESFPLVLYTSIKIDLLRLHRAYASELRVKETNHLIKIGVIKTLVKRIMTTNAEYIYMILLLFLLYVYVCICIYIYIYTYIYIYIYLYVQPTIRYHLVMLCVFRPNSYPKLYIYIYIYIYI